MDNTDINEYKEVTKRKIPYPLFIYLKDKNIDDEIENMELLIEQKKELLEIMNKIKKYNQVK